MKAPPDTRRRVLNLYRRILRTSRTWQGGQEVRHVGGSILTTGGMLLMRYTDKDRQPELSFLGCKSRHQGNLLSMRGCLLLALHSLFAFSPRPNWIDNMQDLCLTSVQGVRQYQAVYNPCVT